MTIINANENLNSSDTYLLFYLNSVNRGFSLLVCGEFLAPFKQLPVLEKSYPIRNGMLH